MCHLFLVPGSDSYYGILVAGLFVIVALFFVAEIHRQQGDADLALAVITFLLLAAVALGIWL